MQQMCRSLVVGECSVGATLAALDFQFCWTAARATRQSPAGDRAPEQMQLARGGLRMDWRGEVHDLRCDRGGTDRAVASFDWLMSALRSHERVWNLVEQPVEFQRRVGWDLLTRVAEQQLRSGRSCVVDLVAREQIRQEWEQLARDCNANFLVVECICSDEETHRGRVEGRVRGIPGWYELDWESVERGRRLYEPLAEPKVVIDAVKSVDENLASVLAAVEVGAKKP